MNGAADAVVVRTAPASKVGPDSMTRLRLALVSCLAVVHLLGGCGGDGLGTSDHSESWRLLTDRAAWHSATADERLAAARAVESGLAAFRFESMETAGEGLPEVATFRHATTGMTFSLIPGGRFEMGSPLAEAGHREDETLHWVTVQPFLMAQHEVKTSLWKTVMGTQTLPDRYEVGGDHPVSGVTRRRARDFCETVDLDLPTEAMWEFAVRAGTTTRFPWGDDLESLDEYAWTAFTSPNEMRPVGQLRPNPNLLYDVFGNVSEWCLDDYGPYPEDDATEPVPPAQIGERLGVMRGWSVVRATDDLEVLTSFFGSARRMGLPRNATMLVGFRPCLSLDASVMDGSVVEREE